MSCWNHRVRLQKTKHMDGTIEDWFDITEAHYNSQEDARQNKSNGWTMDSIAPGGHTIDELREELERMLKCLDKPIVEEKDIIDVNTLFNRNK